MRISQKILFGNFKQDININRAQMGKLQSDLSSGRRVRVPSHSPIEFQRSRVIDDNLRKEEQYQKNIENGMRQGRMAQEMLDNILDRVIDIKRILTQAATDSMNADNRENFADEITGIRTSIVDSLNTSFGNRFLFAGNKSDTPPFEHSEGGGEPGGVAYRNDTMADLYNEAIAGNDPDAPPKILVADGIHLDISISGFDFRTINVQYDGAGNAEYTDFFEVIQEVETALRNDDTDALNQMIGDVDMLVDHVTKITSGLGNNLVRLDYMFEEYESKSITQEANKSSLIDTDFAEGFSDLQRTQLAFEAAMAIHSTMFNNSLLHYL